MKVYALIRQLDPLRLIALALFGLPLFALIVFGMVWLWQEGAFVYWLGALVVCAGVGYGLQRLLVLRDRKLLADVATEPNPDWPPRADEVWARVKALADSLEPNDWPLDDGEQLLELGKRTLETVAGSYHPEYERPLLELTVPHALLIIERASRDLRGDIVGNVPFSHSLTIGDMFRLRRWTTSAENVFKAYRVGRMVINPIDALIGEAWRQVRDRGLGAAGVELHRWLLHAFVRKVGYYAIDLYSGNLPLDEAVSPTSETGSSRKDQRRLENKDETAEEPLRILVLGRSNAGKSSLINALFGELAAASDVLPGTTRDLVPLVLEREGMIRALVFDSPACDIASFGESRLGKAVLDADLVLWVSPVNRPDRRMERECLDALRAVHAARPDHRPPPILAVATHIDQLRPVGEWQPPYDLANPESAKAANIRDAVVALATDLDIAPERVIPVCLAEGRQYNVEDTLWAAMLGQQREALRTRLLRCLDARRRSGDWQLLGRQLVGAGRFLKTLPGRIRKGE